MTALPSSLVAGLTAWLVVGYTMLQVYAALLLLRGGGHREARLSLAALFGLNALYTTTTLPQALGWSTAQPAWGLFVDDTTNAALILTAELAAAAVLGRRPRWALALLLGGFAGAMPMALRFAGTDGTAAFTLLTYGYASVRLAQAHREASEGLPSTWAMWLLAAFVPRFVEFFMAYAERIIRFAPWATQDAWWPLTFAAMVALGAGVASTAISAVRRGGEHQLLLGSALLAGVLLSGARYVPAPSILFYGFSLAVIRPALVLWGIARSGLLDASVQQAGLTRAGILALGAAGTFALADGALAGGLPGAVHPLARLLVPASAAVVSLPLWVRIADWTERGVPPPAPAPPAAAAPVQASPETFPGLDAACRFGPSHHQRYRDLARRASTLPPDRAHGLAALTRGQRVLLALRGSSAATLGRPEFSQAGLQFATHIPYRYLATVIKGLNAAAEPGRLVETSTGVRGIRHYWLTEQGRREANAMAWRLGLDGAGEEDVPLGEAFFAPSESRPVNAPPARPA